MNFKIAILTLTIGLLYCTKASCSKIDTTIFTSQFEKQAFCLDKDSSSINYFDLFIALDFKTDYLNNTAQLKSYFDKLKKETESMPLKKKLKYLFKTVHSDMLKHYTEDAFFHDIFQTGNYNCVTASALYALLFNELGIKYIIKETETHVYLIADPLNTSFVIETTSVTNGIIQYDSKVKVKYVEYLHGNKIISDEEFNSQSTDNLFSQYYIKDKSITLKQLAGIQYYNKGIFLYEDSKYKEALVNFEKAQLLNNSEQIKYMTSNTLTNLLSEEPAKKKYQGTLLAKYINVNKRNSEVLNQSVDHFNYIMSELGINHPNIEALDKYYKDFVAMADTNNVDEYSNRYYSVKGYYFYTTSQYFQALNYLSKAYQINPDNVSTQAMLKEIVIKHLNPDKNNVVDPDSLDSYYNRFSFFRNIKDFSKYLTYCYGKYVYDNYENNNILKGDYYLYRFEQFLDNNPGIVVDEDLLQLAYTESENCYIRKYDYNDAIQLAQKALNRLPKSMF